MSITRIHTPENVKKNEEESIYTNTMASIDTNDITDAKTKAVVDKIIDLIKSLKETSKKTWA
tara:strand:+ start:255 stop:440 length:186 start_codon:yes stop_codon:yes gene_type:complete